MEALLILFAEFLFAPFIAACAIGFELLVTFLSLLLDILIGISWRKKQGTTDGKPPARLTSGRTSPLFRNLRNFSLAVLAITLSAILIVNFFLVSEVLYWGTARLKNRTGIEVQYSSASANLLSGAFAFKNLRVSRHDHPDSIFNLNAEHLSFDLKFWKIFSGSTHIETLKVNGLTGEFKRIRTAAIHKKPKRPFVIEHVVGADFNLTLSLPTHAGTHHESQLIVSSLHIEPFRSKHAAFDLLLRSNIVAELAGGKITFKSKQITDGRETQWQVTALPLAGIAPLLPAPLSWATSGTLNGIVTDSWALGDDVDIEMDWDVEILEPQLVVPNSLPLLKKSVAVPVAGLLNRTPKVPLKFTLSLDHNTLKTSSSPETLTIWRSAADQAVDQLAKLSKSSPEKIKEGLGTGVDTFKSFIEKRRQ